MIALSVGVMVFWPALMAMRPNGVEAEELATLKGGFEALQVAAQRRDARRRPRRWVQLAPHRCRSGERFVCEGAPGTTASAKNWACAWWRSSVTTSESHPTSVAGVARPVVARSGRQYAPTAVRRWCRGAACSKPDLPWGRC
jgi:hypothetical protein